MCLLSNYTGSFCEIKTAGSFELICAGYVESASDESIAFSRLVFFGEKRIVSASGVIMTFLGQARGLQVFGATISSIDEKNIISFINLHKIVDTDRRAAYRIVADLPALVTVSTDCSVGYDAIIKDISVQGISLWINKCFNIDDIVRVQFPLGAVEQKICVCDCNIVRAIGSNNYMMKKYGCEFSDISSETTNIVKSFITEKRTRLMQQEFYKK